MQKQQNSVDNNITQLPLAELRQLWAEYWGIPAHRYIGRLMLEKSIIFKQQELAGEGFTVDQQSKLIELIKAYKRQPQKSFAQTTSIKPGTRLIKTWQGQRYVVTALPDGFEYNGQVFSSLSVIATTITGTRWNGWAFFGLKNKAKTS